MTIEKQFSSCGYREQDCEWSFDRKTVEVLDQVSPTTLEKLETQMLRADDHEDLTDAPPSVEEESEERVIRVPNEIVQPSREARTRHELIHCLYRARCEVCVRGAGDRQDHKERAESLTDILPRYPVTRNYSGIVSF